MCQIWMSGLFFKGAFIHDSRAQTVSNQSALFLSAAGMPTKGQSWGQGQTMCASTAEVKSTFCLASPELHRCFLMSSGDFCSNVLKSDLTTRQQKNKQKKVFCILQSSQENNVVGPNLPIFFNCFPCADQEETRVFHTPACVGLFPLEPQ